MPKIAVENNTLKYNYLVVGAGPFGLSFARSMADAGRRVLLIDKRDVIGGTLHSERIDGVDVHMHGPHIFHTNSRKIWDFVNRFTKFHYYFHSGRVMHKGRMYSFPINLFTLNQVFGVKTPAEAEAKLREVSEYVDGDNLESWCLRTIGRDLYEMFVKGYTTKQWDRDPSLLPALIIRRVPIRLAAHDRYFDDQFQGMPLDGWAVFARNITNHPLIDVRTGVDFIANQKSLMSSASKTVFSGSPDALFGYDEGPLEFRSLRFEHEQHDGDYQGCSTLHYPELDVPYTRIVEYKHFMPKPEDFKRTTIVKEYPAKYDGTNEPYYPVNTDKNNDLAARYIARAAADGIICGGRLGSYKYMNIDQVIGQAMSMCEKLNNKSASVAVAA